MSRFSRCPPAASHWIAYAAAGRSLSPIALWSLASVANLALSPYSGPISGQKSYRLVSGCRTIATNACSRAQPDPRCAQSQVHSSIQRDLIPCATALNPTLIKCGCLQSWTNSELATLLSRPIAPTVLISLDVLQTR